MCQINNYLFFFSMNSILANNVFNSRHFFCFVVCLFFFLCSPAKTPDPDPPHKEKKYIVYESCLMELFERCAVCTRLSEVSCKTRGTMVTVEQTCNYCAQKVRTWRSQPLIRSSPHGNIQLSAACFIGGESFAKLERVNIYTPAISVTHFVWIWLLDCGYIRG